jgi:hypothetical protein
MVGSELHLPPPSGIPPLVFSPVVPRHPPYTANVRSSAMVEGSAARTKQLADGAGLCWA